MILLPPAFRARSGSDVTRAVRLLLSILCSTCLAPASAYEVPMAPVAAQGSMQVAFAPWEDVEGLLVEVIDQARSQILMQAYLLTSKKIATALIAARHRGVDVQVLADEAQSHVISAKLSMLLAAGVPVWMETKYQNAHNKVIVIDAATTTPTVVTGSFNFTWTAQHKNAENILIMRNNPTLTAHYHANWQRHRLDARPFALDSDRRE